MHSIRLLTGIQEGVLADALYEDSILRELSLISRTGESILGNIYIGKVKNIVQNIQAAFVEVEGGLLCYLPLDEVKQPIYTRPKKQTVLCEGDELLVQVTREALKTKAPSVSANLSFTGKYLVLTTGDRKIGCSAKLKSEQRQQLKEIARNWDRPDIGLILRTNAAEANEEELTAEYERLLERYRYITEMAVHHRVFSCVWQSPPAYLSSILGSRSEFLQEILTDEPELYEQIRAFLTEEMPEDLPKLRLYDDRRLPMKALYRLDKGLKDALDQRVWLKSGGYLVIEQTEALTVVDVNTGKCTEGKEKEKTIRKINQEAAAETARQLRLRNLSGIILVDFVDMSEKEADQWLLKLMQEQLRQDPMKATAVDMTALGLMEITRKKQRKTLMEQAKECNL